MGKSDRSWRLLFVAMLMLATVALAACGGGSGSSSTAGSTDGSEGGESTTAAAESSSGSGEAASIIAPYVGKASPIPVDEPLKELPQGKTFAYVQCGVPECAVVAEGAKEAAAALGAKLTVIPAGGSANSINQAFESAAQLKPDVVLEDAIDPVLWPKPYAKLKEEGIPVIGWTIPEESGEGLTVFNNAKRFSDTGKLMAAYVADKAEGAGVHSVFFWPPDYTVFKGEAETFENELTRLCPECTAELVTAPSTTIGKELPSRVVSYLQQNPETDWVGFAFGSMVQGVPEALSAAGLSADTISQAGGEPNWQYLKEGKQTVDLSGDIQIEAWVAMDIAARLATGQELPKSELNGSTPQQFLTQEDVTFDPSEGFHPFPDYQATFKKLWGVN